MASTRSKRAAGVLAVAVLLILLPATSAVAHGGDSDQAQVLVIDALAYLANQPDGYMDHATDKINDALAAPDKEGVDLSKVAAAKQALDGGDMMQVRELLQTSLEPMTGPVVGDDTGTTVMVDPMPGSTTWTTVGAITTAILSGLAIVVGLWLARRWRPADSLRALRARLTSGGTS